MISPELNFNLFTSDLSHYFKNQVKVGLFGSGVGLSAVLGFSAAYACYYLISVAKKPILIAGGKKFHQFIKYQQYELITAPDGGQISLDWFDNDESASHPDQSMRPTVLLLPGLTGTSRESYILHMVQQSRDLGYRCVVFNNRGVSGEKLLTPRTYCAANTEDLEVVIEHVQRTIDKAPLMAAGVSMGGGGSEVRLKGVVVFSAGWDVFECTASLEKPLDRFLFNSYLTSCLQASVDRHRTILEKKYDIDHVMKAKTIREFDERFTSVMFGYPSNDDYYRDASPIHKIKSVQVPMLCLNAADDVFSPNHAFPVEAVKQNPNVALLITCHGGHIGFLEGLWPRQSTYMDRVFRQFTKAVFENGSSLDDLH
uniref:Phospholipase ABHD3 n=1 Tax=Sinocyclocheilus grahami TaxID=75366 RepID=A0A672S4V6_SINGR